MALHMMNKIPKVYEYVEALILEIFFMYIKQAALKLSDP